MTDTHPLERVATIAATLRVTHSTGLVDGWERWTLGHNPDGPDHFTCGPTHVIRGLSCLIVTGDMGDMIFERYGGLGLSFARCGLRYVAEKCRAGEPWAYDAEKAREELLAQLREDFAEIDKDEETAAAEKYLEAEELDFEDERGVWQWYYDNISPDDVPHFGRVPSDLLFRVLGCIEAVYQHEVSSAEGKAEANAALAKAFVEGPSREFYLLDMRHKPKPTEQNDDEDACDCGRDSGPPMHDWGAPLRVWWGPNNSGYGNSLALPFVGKYTAETILEGLNYYRPGERTLPIPCDVAERFAVPRPETCMGMPGKWCDGPGPSMVNHALMWDLLEPLAWIPTAGDLHEAARVAETALGALPSVDTAAESRVDSMMAERYVSEQRRSLKP